MTENTPGSVHRRTVVAGAAWTIPVVATAIGAPLAAASGTGPTLAFTNGPYSVAACGTLKDVVMTATTDGTAAAPQGTPVTVTLPAGLTWSDGDTGSRIFPTDGNGEVVLSGVKATGTPGTGSISATTTGASTSAPVSVSGGAAFYRSQVSGGPVTTFPVAVPSGAQPVGTLGWLAEGTLYDNSGAVIATDVVAANSEMENWGTRNAQYFTWTTTDGTAFYRNQVSGGSVSTSPVAVPSGAQPVGTLGWLADGTLYDNSGTVIATDVATADSNMENWGDRNAQYFTWTTTDGTAFYRSQVSGGPASSFPVAVPSGAQSVGTLGWLAGGTLYDNSGTVIATDVASASSDMENWGTGNAQYFTWTTMDGTAFYRSQVSGGPASSFAVAVPSGGQPVGTLGWLVGGTLYDNAGTVIATDVNAASSNIENWGTANAQYFTWTAGSNC
ncbi:hypothetical protein C1I63_08770 [Rathayibacter caricis DSM 15933]|uniref:Uncharacterized protein n=1 Tax=Rathayibacter caricis DSM 15933 TaxID=1328867 RepID=A0A2T4UTS1_9MICO|nr:hypothetical protein [Rathayibacter caricis]PTL72932.1 hypothetical protein C1I63_08770 [Rathayibacter caricis DSM 15933]